ncbi:MAG: hypothetical protein IJ806_06020 [Ruminococcus sp.]|nr:hypothetical protein [Ruminococcus sp.]
MKRSIALIILTALILTSCGRAESVGTAADNSDAAAQTTAKETVAKPDLDYVNVSMDIGTLGAGKDIKDEEVLQAVEDFYYEVLNNDTPGDPPDEEPTIGGDYVHIRAPEIGEIYIPDGGRYVLIGEDYYYDMVKILDLKNVLFGYLREKRLMV